MNIRAWFRQSAADGADGDMRQWRTAIAFAVGLCIATGALVWLAYVATRQWQRGTELLQERRAAEALALAHAAVVRDMRGAWVSFLVSIDRTALEDDPPYDLLHRSAQTFALFPYVESVVVWRQGERGREQTYAFVRSDRPPAWAGTGQQQDSFPVLLLRDPPPFAPVMAQLRKPDQSGSPFSLIDTAIDGSQYQIVTHVFTDPASGRRVDRIVALVINLEWVRRFYFGPILEQIASIGGVNDSVSFSVTDEHDTLLASTGPVASAGTELQRRFPFIFMESTALRVGLRPLPAAKEFAVHVRHAPGTTANAVLSGGTRILLLIGLAALASIAALLQTVRAVRGSVRLATMKSEFVSAVTHELKTPLVTIRLVGDTLAHGRYASPETIQEYARMLSQEAGKLSQSIDHLLTYARYSEEMPPAALTMCHVHDIVDDAVERFRATLSERDGTLEIDLPPDLPPVFVDARAASQAVEILIDNALKYSPDRPAITIRAAGDGAFVSVTVSDRGIGIHPDDVARVHERFFRGRNAPNNGSGLGLAIANRIVRQNGGDLRITSELGVGTEVHLLLRTERA
ncbi:MAG: HAMP domain-containing sensor histidine kinase [Vicinamibacterales bacterium]